MVIFIHLMGSQIRKKSPKEKQQTQGLGVKWSFVSNDMGLSSKK